MVIMIKNLYIYYHSPMTYPNTEYLDIKIFEYLTFVIISINTILDSENWLFSKIHKVRFNYLFIHLFIHLLIYIFFYFLFFSLFSYFLFAGFGRANVHNVISSNKTISISIFQLSVYVFFSLFHCNIQKSI